VTQEGRVALRASSASPDSTPVWVDITAYLNDSLSAWAITTGRQNPLAQSEPARLSLVLNNADHRFTPGNPTSPYFPWWTQGCRLQLQESIGSWSSSYPDFFLELPDVLINLPDVDQTVTINAVDRLGRLQSSSRFVSTLAEQIIHAGGSSLVHYWPLNESVGPVLRSLIGVNATLSEQTLLFVPSFPVVGPGSDPVVVYGGASALEGDELQGILYNPTGAGGSVGALRTSSHLGSVPAISVASGQIVALAMWVNWTRTTPDGPLVMQASSGATSYVQVNLDSVDNSYYLSARDDTSAQTDLDTSIPGNIGAWRLVAIRLSEPAGLVEFWHHGDPPITYTLGGAPSTITGLTSVRIGNNAPAQMAHLQIYQGSGSYTRAQHLAQVQQGYLGLEGQHTGERIRTLARYARIPEGEVDANQGVAVMRSASLAGKDPLTAMREAETTEQGRLYCRGSSLIFRDRRRRYDI
jgi:Concanavalin A-like lectin/glucanases superfamily